MIDSTWTVATSVGMRPLVRLKDISGVPVLGTGLAGSAWERGTSIWSVTRLQDIMMQQAADLRFTATEIDYRHGADEASVAEFLGDDAASVRGGDAGAMVMGPTGLAFTGFIYIPEGTRQITVRSDDGFSLDIGGVKFSHDENGRGTAPTHRVAEFDGGLYAIRLIYFDNYGGQSLTLEIDGLVVDQSALYRSRADFLTAMATQQTVPV